MANRSVKRLGWMLDRALDRGDYDRCMELGREMNARALESEDELLASIDWWCASFPAFADRFRRDLLAIPPDVWVAGVKRVREQATSPTTPKRERDKAARWLRDRGFDDESLRAEDAELG
jgi:hypothetical protein